MPITVQLWAPDTCGCKILEQYDTANPSVKTPLATYTNPRGEVYNRHVCSIHSILEVPDNTVQRVAVLDENTRKNNVVNRIIETIRVPIEEAGIRWSWQGSGTTRILHVQVPNITITQRTNVITWITTNYPGRIVID
jgi:hypothetical protein